MVRTLHHFELADYIGINDLVAALNLALFSATAIHGQERMCLECRYELKTSFRTCTVDVSTGPGQSLAELLSAYLRQSLGPDSFTLRRFERPAATPAAGAAGAAA